MQRDVDMFLEKVEELRLIKDKHPALGLPLIRGTVNFLAAMVNGVKALMYSAVPNRSITLIGIPACMV